MLSGKKISRQKKRRLLRVRSRIKKNLSRSRVVVFRSLKQIYAQVVDQSTGKTLVSYSSLQLKSSTGDKKEVAFSVGLKLAQQIQEQGIEEVVFDRGSYLYHGRVKALADGLRKGGLRV